MGAKKDWAARVVGIPNPSFNNSFFEKLFFGMSGLEIRELKAVLNA